jgi:hypothetical protein
MEREDILRRLRGLNAKRIENGCTEAEATSAAELLARMMDRHCFEQSDLALPGKVSELTTATWRPAKKLGAMNSVAGAVGLYADCRVWINGRGTHHEAVAFFGHVEDTMLASFLMDSFQSAMGVAWLEYVDKLGAVIVNGRAKKVANEKERETFEVAMMSRLYYRLGAMKTARNAETYEDGTKPARTGREMVVVKTKTVDEGFAALGMKLRTARASRKKLRGAEAYEAGRSAGDRVNITTGLT